MTPERLQLLFARFFEKTAIDEEREELAALLKDGSQQDEVMRLMKESWDSYEQREHLIGEASAERMMEKILGEGSPEEETPVIPIRRAFPWRRIAAAVVVLGVLTASILWWKDRKSAPVEIVKQNVPTDISAPVNNRAQLELATGEIIYLDSMANGRIVTQNGVQLVKLADGQIAYEGKGTELLMNTLRNPRGSQPMQVALPDGSQIWLNAGSSVTYPIAFTGNERKVSMTGEAYFEISHDATRPFYVAKGDVQVQVLGTHFNVNAYDDEPELKVTLLEGSVNVQQGEQRMQLKPGQQAQVNGVITLVDKANIEEVMAWKNGRFYFSDADITEVMRQLSRWYDVEIRFSGTPPPGKLRGEIGRDLTLSQLLDGLSATRIHYTIDGNNKITILPK